MHEWPQAPVEVPEYYTDKELLTYKWLTLFDHDNPNVLTNKFSSGDTYELFQQNLQTQPEDWHYRTKKVEYIVNSKGYRAPEFDNIPWRDSIVVFGCSMTAGIGVAEDETITHYLSKKADRPVINLGVPGAALDFTLTNNYLLRKNYPKPWAVINLFTNTHRLTRYKKMHPEFLGLWSKDDPYWSGFFENEYNPIMSAMFKIDQIKWMWSSTKTFNASYFDDAAYYGKCHKLEFGNTARDLTHCGRLDNKRNASLIWSYLRNT